MHSKKRWTARLRSRPRYDGIRKNWSHSGGRKVGMQLRSTEVLVFGNPKADTTLIQAEQTIGVDLPFKLVIRQNNKTRLGLPTTAQSGEHHLLHMIQKIDLYGERLSQEPWPHIAGLGAH